MGSWMSEASSSVAGSMRSPLSSFTRSPMTTMPSPVSSRLTLEFETAFLMEAEEPVRFSSTDNILPYLSHLPSSRSASSSSGFDSSGGESEEDNQSRSTSFCDFRDSHRITLGNLIGLPMDSFRYVSESFRLRMHMMSRDSSTAGEDHPPPRHRSSRTCSLLGDLFRCLQRTTNVATTSLTSLASFTITEVDSSEEEDRARPLFESDSLGPTVFDNSVFMERDALGSRIYEFNPLYISDAISEADSTAPSRTMSLDHVPNVISTTTTTASTPLQTPRLSAHQPLSPMRAILTTVCCQLGDESDEYMSE